MELPKNITQIGEADAKCKIYVEDYVVSFLKQLNPIARDKTMAAALYGRKKTEDDKTYLFVYGAGKLDFIQKELRHLSQAQLQEIERIRRQYFGDYEFLGYRILNGEMVDGFHVCEQDICRYVSGYAQFYENNEAMLTYMLESRQEEAAPESVDSEKYDMVKDRQEKRRAKFSQHRSAERSREQDGEKGMSGAQKRGLQTAAAAMLLLLCALGLSLNVPLAEKTETAWDKLKAEFTDRKLPQEAQDGALDSEETGTVAQNRAEVLRADDKLTEAVQAENEQKEAIPVSGKVEVITATEEGGEGDKADAESGAQPTEQTAVQATEQAEEQGTAQAAEQALEQETAQTAEQAAAQETVPAAGQTAEQETAQVAGQATEQATVQASEQKAPTTYIVCRGDTLTGISLRIYGSGNHIEEICQMNHIKNPDEIQIGQKILLP